MRGSRSLLRSQFAEHVWQAQGFSNYMTQLLHDLGHGPFDGRLQLTLLEYLSRSPSAVRALAENYGGLPAQPDS